MTGSLPITHRGQADTRAPRESDASRDSADHLTDLLRSVCVEHAHCLLLVDPSLRPLDDHPESGALFSHAAQVAIPVEHKAFPPEHRPLLIDLDLSTDVGIALLAESVRQAYEDREPDSVARGHGQRIGGWLFGNAPADDVANDWSNHILQWDDAGQRRVLRFYDARALSLIWPVLSEPQRRCLLGPVRAWYALGACGEIAVYRAAAVPQPELALSGEQWRALHRHGAINRALALHMKEMGRQPDAHEVETAVASAERADRRGLADYQDKVRFVGHALNWHPEFDSHPGMAPVWGRVETGMLYSAAASELESRVVEDIRRGAWQDVTHGRSR
ncbi:protein of unknown function DUF4123 [Burkholderia sp. lig30]|nr:protein of unknown function DUF4123 [Burkholderia sp. lig30]